MRESSAQRGALNGADFEALATQPTAYNPSFPRIRTALTMRKLLALLLVAALVFPAAAADDVARRLAEASFGQTLAENDPRVVQARSQLDKAVNLTHEEPMAVAAACSRYAGHLFDAIHERATPLELLEALAAFGKADRPMNDTLLAYVAARKAAPHRNHAAALTALGGKR